MTTLGDVLDRGRPDLLTAAAASFPPQSIDGGPAVSIAGPDLAELRSIEIGAVLRTGWSAIRQLRDAGHTTVAEADAGGTPAAGAGGSAGPTPASPAPRPAKPREVSLGQVRIVFDFEPVLHISVGPTPVGRLTFKLALLVDLVDYRAVVAAGCLTSVGARAMTARVELTVNGHELHSPAVPLSPKHELTLPEPVALVPGARCAPAEPPTRPLPPTA
jgi:hypothetical protein